MQAHVSVLHTYLCIYKDHVNIIKYVVNWNGCRNNASGELNISFRIYYVFSLPSRTRAIKDLYRSYYHCNSLFFDFFLL